MPGGRLVAIGRIGRSHGISGEVRLDVGEGLSRGLSGYTRFYLGPREIGGAAGGEPTPITLERVRSGGRFLLLKFPGVDTPEAAARLVHSRLYVERAEMPPLGPDEYYHADLLGCRVVGADGEELGCVDDVYFSGAHDLLVVRSGRGETMIPVVGEYVEELNLETRLIRVRLPEGGF